MCDYMSQIGLKKVLQLHERGNNKDFYVLAFYFIKARQYARNSQTSLVAARDYLSDLS